MNKLQKVTMTAHAGVCVQLQGAAGLAGTTPLPANWGGGEPATSSQRVCCRTKPPRSYRWRFERT